MDIIYAVLFVLILGGGIGFMAVNNRMEPAEVKAIHDKMVEDRDAYLPTFEQMAFELEVMDKELRYVKYPLPDERYFLEVKALTPTQLADGQPQQGIFYDFAANPNMYIVSIPGGKRIREGDVLVKAAGHTYFLVNHPKDKPIDTLDLHWRLFFPTEIQDN